MGHNPKSRGRITITLMSGPLDGKTLEWDRPDSANEMVLTIGRREGCDISLDYDTQVSRVHARLVYSPESHTFFLEDAGSRNGTFVGSARLTERTSLEPGTLFRVGRTWLRVDPSRSLSEDTDRGDSQD
jgi:pSer/pThr/pTyr-binding forkhead associated (FHA) protein